MPDYFFNSVTNGEYLHLLIVGTFSESHFSSKTSSPVTNSNLPTFPDDKAEILVVYLSV